MSKSKNEQWRSIKEFGNYLVSNQGKVMNAKTGKILKPYDNRNGYERVKLYKDGKKIQKQVHRLVGVAFIDNPNNLETINHIDQDKHNNNVDNLEWMSQGDNVRYSLSKAVEQYDLKSGELLATYPSTMAVERLMGFANSTISMACRGQYKQAYGYIWKYKDNNVFTDEDYER